MGVAGEMAGEVLSAIERESSGKADRAALNGLIVLFDFFFSRCEREVKLLDLLPKDRDLI